MAKTRLEKIASYEERIAQLENQKKLEQQRLKKEERKIRDRRLYKRAALFESLLPETISLTEEQFNTLLLRTVANNFGRDRLAQIITEGETALLNLREKPTTAKTTAATVLQELAPSNTTVDNTANTQPAARSGA